MEWREESFLERQAQCWGGGRDALGNDDDDDDDAEAVDGCNRENLLN